MLLLNYKKKINKMRNTKLIDPSLNKKIAENERKIHILFDTELVESRSKPILTKPLNNSKMERNYHHKKNKSQDEIYSTAYKKKFNEKSNYKSTIDTTPYNRTIQFDGDENSTAFANKMEKKIKGNNNKKEEEKNSKIYNTTYSKVYQKNKMRDIKPKKPQKVYNKEELNNIVERLYNNDYKSKKQIHHEKENSINDFSLNTDSRETPMKKKIENVNVDEMINRFKEDKKKRDKNIEKKREEIKNNEKQLYTYRPLLNKKSKKYCSMDKDNFLERQKKYDEKMKEKEKRYIEDLKKKEQEEIDNNNCLLKKKNRKESDTKINKKESVDKMINDMYEWEKRRKEKLEKKQNEKKNNIETKYDYKPKINERSNSIAKNKNRLKDPDVFSRLAKEDKLLKEKRKLLIELYTPSFKPNTARKEIRPKKKKKENAIDEIDEFNAKKSKKKKKKQISNDSDEDDEDEEDEDEEDEENEDEEEEEEEEEKFDYKQDPKIYAEDNVQDALRKALLNKIKK